MFTESVKLLFTRSICINLPRPQHRFLGVAWRNIRPNRMWIRVAATIIYLEYLVTESLRLQVAKRKYESNGREEKAPPRFELGFLDSKSKVVTTGLWGPLTYTTTCFMTYSYQLLLLNTIIYATRNEVCLSVWDWDIHYLRSRSSPLWYFGTSQGSQNGILIEEIFWLVLEIFFHNLLSSR
jgi:hypothetical protein